MNQIFQHHLERLFGEQVTICDVQWTEAEVFFSLPVTQQNEFPHGVAILVWGIEGALLKCSMNEISLEGQLALMDALNRANQKGKSCTSPSKTK